MLLKNRDTFLDGNNWHGLWDNSFEDTASLAAVLTNGFPASSELLLVLPAPPCLLTKWSHLSPSNICHLPPASVGNEIGTEASTMMCYASIYDNFRRDFVCAGMSANHTLTSHLRTVFENDKPATKDDAPKIIFRSK